MRHMYMSPIERQRERSALELLVDTYIARGGQIVRVPRGATAFAGPGCVDKDPTRNWGWNGEYYGR